MTTQQAETWIFQLRMGGAAFHCSMRVLLVAQLHWTQQPTHDLDTVRPKCQSILH